MAPSFLAAARAVTVGLVERTGDLVREVYHGLRDAQDVSEHLLGQWTCVGFARGARNHFDHAGGLGIVDPLR